MTDVWREVIMAVFFGSAIICLIFSCIEKYKRMKSPLYLTEIQKQVVNLKDDDILFINFRTEMSMRDLDKIKEGLYKFRERTDGKWQVVLFTCKDGIEIAIAEKNKISNKGE